MRFPILRFHKIRIEFIFSTGKLIFRHLATHYPSQDTEILKPLHTGCDSYQYIRVATLSGSKSMRNTRKNQCAITRT